MHHTAAELINKQDFADGLTLSEALYIEKWDEVLPSATIVSLNIFDKLQYKSIYKANLVAAFTFFLGVLVMGYGAFSLVANPDLKQEDYHAKKVWFFSSGMFCFFTAIAILSLCISRILRWHEKQQAIINSYEGLRKEIINKHKITYAFFAIAEIIFELKENKRVLGSLSIDSETSKNILAKLSQDYIDLYKKFNKIDPLIIHQFSLPVLNYNLSKEQVSKILDSIIFNLTVMLTEHTFYSIAVNISYLRYPNDFEMKSRAIDVIGKLASHKIPRDVSDLLVSAKRLSALSVISRLYKEYEFDNVVEVERQF